MPFDLTSAIPVREREDGLLERDTFDLSSSVPVLAEPVNTKQNWNLLKDPSFKADWEVVKKAATGQLQDVYTILGAPLKWALGMEVDPLVAFPKVVDELLKPRAVPPITARNIKGVLTGKGITETTEGVSGDATILEGLFLAWGASAGIKAVKSNLEFNQSIDKLIAQEKIKTAEDAIAYNIAKDLSKYEKMFTEGGTFPRGVEKEVKVQAIMDGMNKNPTLKSEVMADTYLRAKGIDPKTIIETTGKRVGEANLYDKLKRINELVGTRGSVLIPKVGQKVVFNGKPGKIISIEGQRAELQFLGEKTTAFATLSQLSLPKVEAPTGEGKVEYLYRYHPKGDLENVIRRGLEPYTQEQMIERAVRSGDADKWGWDEESRTFQEDPDRADLPRIFFTPDKDWVVDKDRVQLRIRKGAIKHDLIPDENLPPDVYMEGEDVGVPPEDIEIKVGKNWIPLNQYEPKLSTPTEPTKTAEPQPIKEIINAGNIGKPPEEPPKFPGVSEEFLKQPKKKTTILQYFTPAEYHLKELGFDAKIGQPVREALQDFSIELMSKNEKLINIQKEHHKQLPPAEIKKSNEVLWEYMDKGIPEDDTSIEAQTAKQLRPETEEMLKRINEVNKLIGKPEVKGVKNYILHMLNPEILNDIYAKGVIPPELAKVMEYIPNKNIFLRTAQQRKGIPDEWLSKDPYELMKAMYAIDLRYVYLQKALNDIDPYVKAVKEYVSETGESWSPETFKYLDDWVKQAIKMRPSNWDTLIDNLLENSIAPLLRKTGLRVSHMPWRDFVSFMSAGAHTGALGMRIRPILRNLVQSTFDWVMYGTKPYLKGSAKFMTKEGFDILHKSKVWKTRMPYEAQDLATLQKLFKIGGLGYGASDLHNVGKGLLTRYYHAIDDLKMTPEEAIKWADNDLASTQWSYRREDLPRAYWTTTGRAFWTLGSWWMNYYTRFLPELIKKAYTGKDVMGRVVPTSERFGIIRLLILTGTLFAIKKASKELTGTTVDYTEQVKPTPLRQAPIAQLGASLIKIGQGFTDSNERTRKEGLKELGNTAKIFIPWELAAEDLFKLLKGETTIPETLFYTGRKNKETKPKSPFSYKSGKKKSKSFKY